MSTEWHIKGEYLESCDCRDACPCVFLGAPTEGGCTGLVGWHITAGEYGDVGLDGLNVAVALNTPGPMPEGNWKAVLYLDERADEAQQDALGAIFGGQAGGHPAVLASLIGEVRGVEPMPIHFEVDQGHRHLKIGQSAEADIRAIEGQDGKAVTLGNHPFAVAPGNDLVMASSTSLRHQAHGIDLDLTGRAASYSPFSYAGP